MSHITANGNLVMDDYSSAVIKRLLGNKPFIGYVTVDAQFHGVPEILATLGWPTTLVTYKATSETAPVTVVLTAQEFVDACNKYRDRIENALVKAHDGWVNLNWGQPSPYPFM